MTSDQELSRHAKAVHVLRGLGAEPADINSNARRAAYKKPDGTGYSIHWDDDEFVGYYVVRGIYPPWMEIFPYKNMPKITVSSNLDVEQIIDEIKNRFLASYDEIIGVNFTINSDRESAHKGAMHEMNNIAELLEVSPAAVNEGVEITLNASIGKNVQAFFETRDGKEFSIQLLRIPTQLVTKICDLISEHEA